MSSNAEDLDRSLSYALQWLDSPELRLKTWATVCGWVCVWSKGCFCVVTVPSHRFWEIDLLPGACNRSTVPSVRVCPIPVVLNNATLSLRLTLAQHKRQAFITDMVILAHKYACCLSSEQTIDVSNETMWEWKQYFPSPPTHKHAQIGEIITCMRGG